MRERERVPTYNRLDWMSMECERACVAGCSFLTQFGLHYYKILSCKLYTQWWHPLCEWCIHTIFHEEIAANKTLTKQKGSQCRKLLMACFSSSLKMCQAAQYVYIKWVNVWLKCLCLSVCVRFCGVRTFNGHSLNFPIFFFGSGTSSSNSYLFVADIFWNASHFTIFC